jgi:DNA segregation ATPase FtsK/SpoIIIE, S-DNA-T family
MATISPPGNGLSAFALTVFLSAIVTAGCVLAPAFGLDSTPGYDPAGLWLRSALTDAIGGGTVVFLIGWLAVTAMLFRRAKPFSYLTRGFGWLLLTLAAAILCEWNDPAAQSPLLADPLAGAGGTVGALGSQWLEQTFTRTGSILVVVAVVLAGILFAIDFVVMLIVRSFQNVGRLTVDLWQWLISPRRPKVIQVSVDPPPITVQDKVAFQIDSVPITQLETLPDISTDDEEDEDEPEPARPRRGYELPPNKLLDDPPPHTETQDEKTLRDCANLLEKTFADFGLKVKVVGIHTGPVVTQYEIALETGLRVSKVTALSDDLALNLKVPSVRIVAPIPGKNTVGIEVPNPNRAVVRLKELLLASSAKIEKSRLPLLLGKDSEGRPLVYDLAEMPHLLIAGRTGTGKSVCLNSIILSLLLTRTPEECRLLMIDPKQVELAEYGKLPHLMHPVVTDNSKAEAILSWAVDKMEQRYELLRKSRVRNIIGFNELTRAEILRRVKPADEHEADSIPEKMAYIVIVVDEVGDLMMAMKKEVEGHIIRLAQKSRAAGIHLILTTQRPTVDVITGLIKSNLPARICFQVADRSNSRVVLDEMGAEKLLGKGDMLFLQPSTSTISRAQGTFASDAEILRITSHLEVDMPEYDNELLNLNAESEDDGGGAADVEKMRKRDPLYEQAIEIVIREGRGSVSLLQRAMGIGYGRAARLVDYMAEDGIVGNYNGAQAREVLYTMDQWDQMKNGGATAEAPLTGN